MIAAWQRALLRLYDLKCRSCIGGYYALHGDQACQTCDASTYTLEVATLDTWPWWTAALDDETPPKPIFPNLHVRADACLEILTKLAWHSKATVVYRLFQWDGQVHHSIDWPFLKRGFYRTGSLAAALIGALEEWQP